MGKIRLLGWPCHRILALMIGALVLIGCGGRSEDADPPPVRPAAGPSAAGPACVARLGASGALFARQAAFSTAQGCGIRNPVEVSRAATLPLSQPAVMDCALAEAVAAYEARILIPAARFHLGTSIEQIDHWGTYACRGRSSDRSRLSEHAFGRAIDIAGFRTRDGRRITVARHWRDPGPEGRFIRDVATGACGIFSVVLGPGSDRFHQNHLHLDIGPSRLCRP